MAIEQAQVRYNQLLRDLGTTALNGLFPQDFEVYFIAFELVQVKEGIDDQTIEFFSLPVMPSGITINEPEITNIKKTARGITSLKSQSFVPKNITLQGNFGRQFRVLIRDKVIDFTSLKGAIGIDVGDFNSPNIKTGFGSTKVFKNLLENSKLENTRLYFYNFAFSEHYVVEVVDKTFTQSMQNNMVWNYNVNLRAVAPINSEARTRRSLVSITAASNVQKGINSLAASISSALPII